MPKIPTYESTASLPGNTMAEQSNAVGVAIARAGDNFGSSLAKWGDEKDKKINTVKMLTASNEFHEWNNAEKLRIESEKIGLAADGTFKQYSQDADAKREELVKKHGLTGTWGDAARERLNGVKNTYGDNHAAWEAKQLNIGRKDAADRGVNVARSTVAQDPAMIDAAFAQVEEAHSVFPYRDEVDDKQLPTDRAQVVGREITRGKAAVVASAVNGLLDRPDESGYEEAVALLDQHADLFKEFPQDYAVLKDNVAKEEVPYKAARIVSSLPPLDARHEQTYGDALKVVEGIEREDVREEAKSRVSRQWSVAKARDVAVQSDALESWSGEIQLDDKWKNDVEATRRRVKQTDKLDNQNKDRVLGWIDAALRGSDDPEKALDADPQHNIFVQDVLDDISAGRITKQDLDETRVAGGFTKADFDKTRNALRAYEEVKPSLTGNLSNLRKEPGLQGLFDGGKNENAAVQKLATWATQYRQDTKKDPTLDLYIEQAKKIDGERLEGWFWKTPVDLSRKGYFENEAERLKKTKTPAGKTIKEAFRATEGQGPAGSWILTADDDTRYLYIDGKYRPFAEKK